MRTAKRVPAGAKLPDWRVYTSAMHRDIDMALGWQRDDARAVRPLDGEPDAWQVGVSGRVLDQVDWLRTFQDNIVRLGYDCELCHVYSAAPWAVVRTRGRRSAQ